MKIDKNALWAIPAMVLSLMSGYRAFYGTGGSTVWYFLYYGKYFFVLFIILMAYLQRNTNRTMKLVRNRMSFAVISIPIAILMYSGVVWLFSDTAFDVISRGVSTTLYKVIAFAGGMAVTVLFRKKAPIYAMYACLITYFMALGMGLLRQGTALLSNLFNRQTVEAGTYTELHELAFIMGMYIIYMMLMAGKDEMKKHTVCIILTAICFVIAWKRVGIAAMGVTVLIYLMLFYVNDVKKMRWIKLIGYIGIVLFTMYVYATISDDFRNFMKEHNINVMGRDIIYSYFSQFADFDIGFMGRGVGFVTRQFDYVTHSDLYQMSSIKALHNDFMKIFIETGFVGFLIWCWLWLVKIPDFIKKFAGRKAAFYSFLIIIYAFVTYLSDNTEGYYNFQMNLLLILSAVIYSEKTAQKKVPVKTDNHSLAVPSAKVKLIGGTA